MKFLVRKNIIQPSLDFNMEVLDRKAILRPTLRYQIAVPIK